MDRPPFLTALAGLLWLALLDIDLDAQSAVLPHISHGVKIPSIRHSAHYP
jgi:hypothetical protein